MSKRTLNELKDETGELAHFVRTRRKKLGYTQLELSKRIGVGVRFLKELELGKKSLRMDKVNDVLRFFGYSLHPLKNSIEEQRNDPES